MKHLNSSEHTSCGTVIAWIAIQTVVKMPEEKESLTCATPSVTVGSLPLAKVFAFI